MPVTRSRNGSRKLSRYPSLGASPVRDGDDDRSPSPLPVAFRVVGCRRHPLLRRSLLLSQICLPAVGL